LKIVAKGLAEALVAGPWQRDDLIERGSRAVRRRGRWLRPLIGRLLTVFDGCPRPSALRVAAFLTEDAGFRKAFARQPIVLSGRPLLPAVMAPAPGAPARWRVPGITTAAALADWLGLTSAELVWFSKSQAERRRPADGPLCHYRYRWVAKRSGSTRLIEAPKPRLRAIQRRVLDEILAGIPPHDAAHGYRRGRSARTFVEPHVGRDVVLRMDLQDFFPSIAISRIRALFRTSGYPDEVASLLAGLCTNVVPSAVWSAEGALCQGPQAQRLRRLVAQPHLPQGAPTSPALANLCAFGLDCRLAGLARAVAATYTRYADDLLFSGGPDFASKVERFQAHIGAIVIEEGFTVAFRKTRRMRRGTRQHAAGLILNRKMNIARDEFDTLKATLFNCTRCDPREQNRAGHPDFRAHLAGRIAYVSSIHPERGHRLKTLFDRIVWPDK
jgi:hypothetical protein